MANATAAKFKVAGMVYRAPIGTTPPTDAVTALSSTFVNLGDLSEDGLTNADNTESEDIKNANGEIVLTPQTDHTDKFEFTFLDALKTDVLKTVYGESNVTVASGSGGDLENGITINVTGDEPTSYVWVFELILKGGVAKRIVIPNGKISEKGEVVYKRNEAVGYKVTLTASLGTVGSDTVTHKEFLKEA